MGADELGVDFDEHLRTVIAALLQRRDELMPPTPASASASAEAEADRA
jgi:hypothetical protein